MAARTSPTTAERWILGEKLPVEPGRTRRRHLRLDRKIRARGERQASPSVRVVIDAGLDNGARQRIAGHLEIGELEMMGAPIDACDDRVGAPLQFVVEAPLDQFAQHRIRWLFAMQSELADIRFADAGAHGLVHGLDDVAAGTELPQSLVEARLQRPAGGADRLREAEAFELGGPSKQQAPQLRVFGVGGRSEVRHAAALVRNVAQRAVEACPALRIHLALQ